MASKVNTAGGLAVPLPLPLLLLLASILAADAIAATTTTTSGFASPSKGFPRRSGGRTTPNGLLLLGDRSGRFPVGVRSGPPLLAATSTATTTPKGSGVAPPGEGATGGGGPPPSSSAVESPPPPPPPAAAGTARSVAVAALTEPRRRSDFGLGGGGGSHAKKTKKKKRSDASSSSSSSSSGGGFFASRRLESDPTFADLPDRRDRSFARLLVATVERRCGQIDAVLRRCADVYPPKRGKHAPFLQSCLRVGAAQLLFLDTPRHAAIKETVDVLKMRRDGRPKIPEPLIKFVNAVLRRVSREGNEILERETSPTDNVAPWLSKEWQTSWGEEIASKITEQVLTEPRADLTAKLSWDDATTSDERRRELERLRDEFGPDAKILPHGSIRVGSSMRGSISGWPRYDEGEWWVQDASSALPAVALRDALLSRHGKENARDLHVVDMCAAPGGKTAQLLSFGFGTVTAIESNPRRCRRLRENLERLGLLGDRCEIVVSGGQEWFPPSGEEMEEEVVHGVLLDVPCSATGTGSRRPDVLRRDADLGNLLETQEALANHCADDVLGVGGVLVYATCSLLKRESEDQVRKLLARGENGGGGGRVAAKMRTLPFSPGEIPGFDDAIDDDGWLRVLPGALPGELKSCDGFFVARLVKVG